MAHMMTTKELAQYLKFHPITICKFAGEGKIPAIRMGRVLRYDKEAIDRWIAGRRNNPGTDDHSRKKTAPKKDRRKGGTAKEAS